jgi:hypothetical protein
VRPRLLANWEKGLKAEIHQQAHVAGLPVELLEFGARVDAHVPDGLPRRRCAELRTGCRYMVTEIR